jgi:hypothetical protein
MKEMQRGEEPFLMTHPILAVFALGGRIYQDAKMRRAEPAQSHPELPSPTHGSP